jgi:hypothetical protein
MNTFTTSLLIGGGVLLVVWVFIACSLGFSGFFTHRRWESNPKRAEIYRRFGNEPPPPAGRLTLARTLFSATPLLLFFSLLFIFWYVIAVPFVIFCLITGWKPGGNSPKPPLPPDATP